jgi:hypothetical protein
MAIDGSNRLWVANAGMSANSIPPNLTLLNGGIYYINPDFSNGPSSVAVDNAGNIWVLLGNNTVTEYVGLAAPVVTPLSAGIESGKLGAEP